MADGWRLTGSPSSIKRIVQAVHPVGFLTNLAEIVGRDDAPITRQSATVSAAQTSGIHHGMHPMEQVQSRSREVAADLRRTKFEFLRPEDLLPVTAAAQLLGVSVGTVHNAINAGKLRCHLFGTARRVRRRTSRRPGLRLLTCQFETTGCAERAFSTYSPILRPRSRSPQPTGTSRV